MHSIRRDAGLMRAVGQWGLAASIVNITIGAGIFAVPGALAASIGAFAPLAFLLCGIPIAAVAICLAEGGSRIPTSGGIYGYVAAAFGPLSGYVAGTLIWFSGALACGGITAALADVCVSVLPARMAGPAHAAIIVAVIGLMSYINICGIRPGTRLAAFSALVKAVLLLLFVLIGVGAVRAANFQYAPAPSHGSLGRAVLLALFAYMGMETSLSASGEVAAPARTIPRALALSLGFVAALYTAIQVTAQGILGGALAQSSAPLADAMRRVSPTLGLVMAATASLSMLGWISSDIVGNPRMLFALAADGLLPRVLARVHSRYRTPYAAIICYGVIATLLALTGTFAELAVASTLASAALYIFGCAAAVTLVRRQVALAADPLNFRWLGVAAAVGITAMSMTVALASRAEILGLGALMGVSALVYLICPHRAAIQAAP